MFLMVKSKSNENTNECCDTIESKSVKWGFNNVNETIWMVCEIVDNSTNRAQISVYPEVKMRTHRYHYQSP